MEIILNKCFGGFRLSEQAMEWLMKEKGWKLTDYNNSGKGYKDNSAKIVRASGTMSELNKWFTIPDDDELRVDPDVMDCIRALGIKANSGYSALEIIEIPDGIKWEIDEYDGIESVAEKHRTWG